MNVSLTSELEEFVAGKVKSGRYSSASEVVREALRLLEEHDRTRIVDPVAARERLQRRSRERRKSLA
jgi:antitoxin ParD1/3/4